MDLFTSDALDEMELNTNFYKYCKEKKESAMEGRKFIFFEVLSDINGDGVLWYLPTIR